MTDAATFLTATAASPYQPSGMFYSEIFLFTTICEAAGVTALIESGVRHGMSTRLLQAIWAGRLISVEVRADRIPKGFPYPVVIGDGRTVVPAWLAAHPDDVIGVLLDGPKGPAGDALRRVCATYPQVAVIGQHDSGSGRGETAHSWDPGWRARVGDALDARIPSAVRARYPMGCPGLGVWRTR